MLLVSTSCAVTFMEPVPDPPRPQQMPTCTAHVGLAVADGILAFPLLYSAIALHVESDNTLAIAAFDALTAAVIASAVVGIYRARKCRAARYEHLAWLKAEMLRRQQAPPGPPGSALKDARSD